MRRRNVSGVRREKKCLCEGKEEGNVSGGCVSGERGERGGGEEEASLRVRAGEEGGEKRCL